MSSFEILSGPRGSMAAGRKSKSVAALFRLRRLHATLTRATVAAARSNNRQNDGFVPGSCRLDGSPFAGKAAADPRQCHYGLYFKLPDFFY